MSSYTWGPSAPSTTETQYGFDSTSRVATPRPHEHQGYSTAASNHGQQQTMPPPSIYNPSQDHANYVGPAASALSPVEKEAPSIVKFRDENIRQLQHRGACGIEGLGHSTSSFDVHGRARPGPVDNAPSGQPSSADGSWSGYRDSAAGTQTSATDNTGGPATQSGHPDMQAFPYEYHGGVAALNVPGWRSAQGSSYGNLPTQFVSFSAEPPFEQRYATQHPNSARDDVRSGR